MELRNGKLEEQTRANGATPLPGNGEGGKVLPWREFMSNRSIQDASSNTRNAQDCLTAFLTTSKTDPHTATRI
jgi:hypothetical protein